MVKMPSVAISALIPMRVTISPLTRPSQRPDGDADKDSSYRPASPTSLRRRRPRRRVSASVEPAGEVKYAGDHQQHHAADEYADRCGVEQHGAQVGTGPEVVRIDHAHDDGERGDKDRKASAHGRSAKAAHQAHERRFPHALQPPGHERPSVISKPPQRKAASQPQLRRRRRCISWRASSPAPQSRCRPANSPTVLPSAITMMRSASASTSGRSDDTTTKRHAAVGKRLCNRR